MMSHCVRLMWKEKVKYKAKRWNARMQMTARGEKMKLVTALSRYKKDSSQQSKREPVILRTQMGTAS